MTDDRPSAVYDYVCITVMLILFQTKVKHAWYALFEIKTMMHPILKDYYVCTKDCDSLAFLTVIVTCKLALKNITIPLLHNIFTLENMR